ncbi:MAG TPA: hypothetical protein PKL56_11785 [Cyclobacteriaceae bacterium]|nr:hypothetical protein [Cyclobacteriaceae bacterium]HMV07474.1 hypothetical protein [Cyclobacteriaceae bacterium]HMW99171.1 hypothetical protein [Cyclobacteriaceae bacterium]HMX48196.1 hypothetical protein [Cyclobacteriaceae bacterium]HMY95001.1 hypothetical protein [Cyclobacteriaceae bacterium]
MKTITRKESFTAPAQQVFKTIDDLGVTGMHMTESSGMMMGSKLKLDFLTSNKTGIGSRYRWTGKMMGLVMDFTVEVTKWINGVEKVWETIGDTKLIIYSWYRMKLLLNETNGNTEAELSISYEKPKGFFNKMLCFLLADWYCRWCLKKMLGDAKKAIADHGQETKHSFAKTALIIILLSVTTSVVFAQSDSSGVYKTFDDYKSKKLLYAIDCNTESHKIKSDQFHHKDVVRVVHNDSLFTMPKSEIFGYKDCNGVTYRIVDGKNHSILNPYNNLQLYKHEIRGHKSTTLHYYFSKTIDSAPILLTIDNLRHAFPDNVEFLKSIDENFKRDGQLIKFDKKNKQFIISKLYNASIK